MTLAVKVALNPNTTNNQPAVSEEKIFKEFLHFCIVQEAPIHQSHNFWWIKISRTIFEKGHPRNISVK